jgi:hypothetical protein
LKSTKTKIIQLAINLSISVITIVIMIALLEGGLRFFYGLPAREQFIPHPVLGWAGQPKAKYLRYTPEYRVTIAINSKGWRDVEHDYIKPAGTFRIVILGDSHMEAKSVDLEEAFCRQLEHLIQKSELLGKKIEVINLGMSGYGTLQEYLAFVEEGKRYNPDLVLLAFFAYNDLQDNSYSLMKAISGNSDDAFTVHSRPFLKTPYGKKWEVLFPDYERTLAGIERQNAQRADRPWWEKTVLYTFYTDTNKRLAPRWGSNFPRDPYLLWGMYLCVETQKYRKAWKITERILVRLDNAVQKAGAQLLVFTVPALFETDKAKMKKLSKHIRKSLKHSNKTADFCFETAPANLRLKKILKRHKITYIDLLPIFRQAVREEGCDLFRTIKDKHWNPEGHTLAAREVYKVLLQKKMLPLRR